MSKRAVVSILAVLVLLGGALATVLLIRAGSGSAEVPGSVSPVLSRAQRLGPLPPDRRLPVNVVLRPKDERGLFAVARTVSDPASPEHGHYLSPAELNMRFAPPTGTVQAVVEYLRSRDLEVTAPGLGGDVVTAVGSVRALEAT